MEAIGDTTASAEVSRVEVVGEVFDSRIQGGVLADGFGGFISACFTVTPLSIFAQNNGVVGSVLSCPRDPEPDETNRSPSPVVQTEPLDTGAARSSSYSVSLARSQAFSSLSPTQCSVA